MYPVIDIALVESLIADQFPQYRDLEISAVENQGWDNRSYRIGDHLVARLPSATRYGAAVAKEFRVLNALKDKLPVEIPEVVEVGKPSAAYPLPWSIRNWISGKPLARGRVDDNLFADDLAETLLTLWRNPIVLDIEAGAHSFLRGCHPRVYQQDIDQALMRLGDRVDQQACKNIWQDALKTEWTSPPAMFHGDVAAGNLLVRGGELWALIDFGTCGTGDPACDLAIAWTYFDADRRARFREQLDVDQGFWARGRGWALWKALITIAHGGPPDMLAVQQKALEQVILG